MNERIFFELEDVEDYFPLPWECYISVETKNGARVFVKKDKKTHYSQTDFFNFLQFELYQLEKWSKVKHIIYHTPLKHTVAMEIVKC